MAAQEKPEQWGLRRSVPVPKDFDPFTATQDDLIRHGLPPRPDLRARPGEAALWERLARRYRGFEHLEMKFDPTKAGTRPVVADGPGLGRGLEPTESCGYLFTSLTAPFTILSVTWTVPNLRFVANPLGVNHFQTFVGLGLLDLHLEMTVDAAQNVIAKLEDQSVGIGSIDLPVGPGDVVTAVLCLANDAVATANYFVANETRGQTMSFSVNTGFPPAFIVTAGVGRIAFGPPAQPLARFGWVYFDEIIAFTTDGTRSLTAGDATTMVEPDGTVVARPVRLNEHAFRAVYAKD